jgi:hypothetical protein
MVQIPSTESDLQNVASLTYSFEADTEGWQVVEGTFNRANTDGGANGTSFYMGSSSNTADICDHVRSPVIVPSASTTLSLWNWFDIEALSDAWYDRANIGIFNPANGSRTLVSPDGGRTYNASGANGTCGTSNQNGFGGVMTTWAESTFSAGALGSAGLAGMPIQLDVRYGTDPLEHGLGFRFDQVTVTNVDMLVADAQDDVCATFCTSLTYADWPAADVRDFITCIELGQFPPPTKRTAALAPTTVGGEE